MSRRRVLTDAQLESLIALPRTEPVLVRHWTLDEADLAAIARGRGGGNRLGYACSSAPSDIPAACSGRARSSRSRR